MKGGEKREEGMSEDSRGEGVEEEELQLRLKIDSSRYLCANLKEQASPAKRSLQMFVFLCFLICFVSRPPAPHPLVSH